MKCEKCEQMVLVLFRANPTENPAKWYCRDCLKAEGMEADEEVIRLTDIIAGREDGEN